MVLGLLALGLIVGAIWWATRQGGDEALVADGSTIAAPGQPYRERPKDPGGKTFEGTGDTSFAVSEGQNRSARIGGDSAAQPGFTAVPGAGAASRRDRLRRGGGKPLRALPPALVPALPRRCRCRRRSRRAGRCFFEPGHGRGRLGQAGSSNTPGCPGCATG